MEKFTIILGNKSYSSWSLRGWLALVQTGVDFDEVIIPLRQTDSRARILEYSPSGLVPALRAEREGSILTVCDSLAIAEYLAERFPSAGLWPEDSEARAVARSVAAEMHAGFAALRGHMPMDLRERHPGAGRGEGVEADIERIGTIWRSCRSAYGGAGAFLFGGFTAADAAFAPVVLRFRTYDVALDPVCSAYSEAVLAWPAVARWTAAAEAEPWTIRL